MIAFMLVLSLALSNSPTDMVRPLNAEISCNYDSDCLVPLRSNVYIPDSGEVTWPIYVSDQFDIANIRVSILGLSHEFSGDLRAELTHDTTQITLFDRTHTRKVLGSPKTWAIGGIEYPLPFSIPGWGWTYTFEDVQQENLALNKPSKQSTTAFEAPASRGNDGNVDGYFSGDSVIHTGGWGIIDPQPWWQVDLESEQSIGTVRLWTRIQQPHEDEIQTVSISARSIVRGTFRLSFEHQGSTEVTDEIQYDAVAMRTDELLEAPEGEFAFLNGSWPGESMQAKLEGLPNIQRVMVQRDFSSLMHEKLYRWKITFLTELGNLNQLARHTNGLRGIFTNIETATLREGSANVWTNYKAEVSAITGRTFPCWLMVLDTDVDTASLETAKAAAIYSKRLDSPTQETEVTISPAIAGRYVRVQLESTANPLSLAEVQVFAQRSVPMSEYDGGSPITPVTFQAEQCMNDALAVNHGSKGTWLLGLRDFTPLETIHTEDSYRESRNSGRGALDSWRLYLTESDGTVHEYQSDVRAWVENLPLYGSLYHVYANGSRGPALERVMGLERQLSECYENCSPSFDNGINLSSRRLGDVAVKSVLDDSLVDDLYNRVVLYRPRPGYLGRDFFTYTTSVGVDQSSAMGEMSLWVKKCRTVDCERDEITEDVKPYRDVSHF